MTSPLANSLASMVGVNAASGTVANPVNTGRNAPAGGGVKSDGSSGSRAPVGPPAGRQGPQARPPGPPQRRPPGPPQQRPQQRPQFSANNPQLGTQAPPVPHPGLRPPYPDARSPQPTLTPNGLPIMPPPTGFMQPNMPPRVPATFIPGMTGLLGMR